MHSRPKIIFKDWTEKDGGTLDLFDRDTNGDPKDIVKKLVPKNNSMAFFEVTEKSFHQVAEVLTKDKQRLSIGEYLLKYFPCRANLFKGLLQFLYIDF